MAKRPMACRLRMVGKMISISPARWRVERVVGRDPDLGDRLASVVRRDLPRWRGGHEEAGVVAARGTAGGDPVCEVVDVAHAELQALLPAQVEETQGPGVDGGPGGGEARLLVGVTGQEVGAAHAVGQQEPGLLERLAHHGHPVGEAARPDAQERAGFRVAAAHAKRLGFGPAVEEVHRTPGEHVGATDEVRAQIAPDHEHLEGGPPRGGRGVTHHHDGGRRPDGEGRGFGCARWWRSRWRHAGEGTGRSGRRPREGGTP